MEGKTYPAVDFKKPMMQILSQWMIKFETWKLWPFIETPVGIVTVKINFAVIKAANLKVLGC